MVFEAEHAHWILGTFGEDLLAIVNAEEADDYNDGG